MYISTGWLIVYGIILFVSVTGCICALYYARISKQEWIAYLARTQHQRAATDVILREQEEREDREGVERRRKQAWLKLPLFSERMRAGCEICGSREKPHLEYTRLYAPHHTLFTVCKECEYQVNVRPDGAGKKERTEE